MRQILEEDYMKNFIFFLLFMVLCFPMMAHAFPGGFQPAFVEGNIKAGDTGKPIGGAKIFVIGAKVKKHKIKANQGCGMGFALSAGNGNYAVGVGQNNLCVKKKHPINEKYYVEVSKRGYLSQKTLVDFQKFGRNVIGNLDFTLIPSHSNIIVHVFSGAGPVPYAMVTVMKNPFSLLMKTMNTPSGQYGTKFKPSKRFGPNMDVGFSTFFRADKNGQATIPVSPGDYYVLADKTGYTLTTQNTNPLMQAYGNFMMQSPFMTPAMRAKFSQEFNQPQPGVFVHVLSGGGAVANLTLAPGSVKPSPYVGSTPQRAFIPVEYFLDGQARFSPNNVLFFTPAGMPSDHSAYNLGIVRSRVLLGAGKVDPFKARIKTFNFVLYGWPNPVGCIHKAGHISKSYCIQKLPIYSFTDPTGVPGRVYYYYIAEAPVFSVKGGGINLFESGTPYSNAVQIVTLK